jgi:hypothetical protein
MTRLTGAGLKRPVGIEANSSTPAVEKIEVKPGANVCNGTSWKLSALGTFSIISKMCITSGAYRYKYFAKS